MNVKFPIIVSEESVRLVTPVVLGSHAPVDVGEYWLLFEIYCPEYSTAYFGSPQSRNKESGYLSVFMTFLNKKHVDFYRFNAKQKKRLIAVQQAISRC